MMNKLNFAISRSPSQASDDDEISKNLNSDLDKKTLDLGN